MGLAWVQRIKLKKKGGISPPGEEKISYGLCGGLAFLPFLGLGFGDLPFQVSDGSPEAPCFVGAGQILGILQPVQHVESVRHGLALPRFVGLAVFVAVCQCEASHGARCGDGLEWWEPLGAQAVTLPALAPWALMNTSADAPSHSVQAWHVVFCPRSMLAAQ